MKIPEAIGSAIAIVILMLVLVGLASLITSRLHRSCRIAGVFASLLFSLGVIGTGLLALPVLRGSAAYSVGEALLWQVQKNDSHSKVDLSCM